MSQSFGFTVAFHLHFSLAVFLGVGGPSLCVHYGCYNGVAVAVLSYDNEKHFPSDRIYCCIVYFVYKVLIDSTLGTR